MQDSNVMNLVPTPFVFIVVKTVGLRAVAATGFKCLCYCLLLASFLQTCHVARKHLVDVALRTQSLSRFAQ